MGFCCYKCANKDLFKSILMEDPEPNNKYILIKEYADSKSYSSEEKYNFPSQKSVMAFNQKINIQNKRKPERIDWENKNTDNINIIYENDNEGIYTSRISEGTFQ